MNFLSHFIHDQVILWIIRIWDSYIILSNYMTEQGHNWIYSILNEWCNIIKKLLKKTLILKFLHICIWIVALSYTCKFPHSISHIFSIGFFLLIAVFSRIFFWHWPRFQGAILIIKKSWDVSLNIFNNAIFKFYPPVAQQTP